MAKKQSKLLTIYDNVVLREKIGVALDNKVSYQDIVDMCKTYGIDISEASITRYAQKREEAVKTGKDLRELLDTDTQKAIANIKKKQVDKKPVVKDETEPELVMEKNYSVDIMLEDRVKRGFQMMVAEDTPIAPKDWTAMVKLLIQLNGNNNHGLTTEGLQQLRLFQNAVNNATVSVIAKYVPQEKQKEVIEEIKKEEFKQYKELDSSEQGRALIKALEIGNIDLMGNSKED